MTDKNIRLRLFMRLTALDSANLAADVTRVKSMVEAFLSAPALAAVNKAQVDDQRVKKVTAKTQAEVAATGKEAMIEYFDHPNPKRGAFAQFWLEESEIELRCIVERGEIAKYHATALDDLTEAFVRAAKVWQGVAVVREGHIKFEDDTFPPYARLRVPRGHNRFPQRSVVTFLDPRFVSRADEVKALTEPPPAHAMIARHGELIEVRWTMTLDDQAIAQASTWHDCWIRRIETDLDHRFNALGDELINPGNAKPQAPLTLYNRWLKTGFKAVLVTPEGELEESAWNDARSMLNARALPDGDEVQKIWIVVPLREHAIAVHARVVEAGFEAALYPGQGDHFWDPVPKGPWLSESTDVTAS
jgi:hypothetical protein